MEYEINGAEMTKQKSIYAKLIAARAKFHSSSITKTGYNDFSKYSYFELSDFIVPAMKIMANNDLIPIISFAEDLATMTVYDITSEATIVITSPMSTAALKACQPVQSLGAVETFQRRYLWVALLEIAEHDVIEESTVGDPNDTKPEAANEQQMAVIRDYKDAGKIPESTQAWLDKHEALSEKQAKTLIKKLKAAA